MGIPEVVKQFSGKLSLGHLVSCRQMTSGFASVISFSTSGARRRPSDIPRDNAHDRLCPFVSVQKILSVWPVGVSGQQPAANSRYFSMSGCNKISDVSSDVLSGSSVTTGRHQRRAISSLLAGTHGQIDHMVGQFVRHIKCLLGQFVQGFESCAAKCAKSTPRPSSLTCVSAASTSAARNCSSASQPALLISSDNAASTHRPNSSSVQPRHRDSPAHRDSAGHVFDGSFRRLTQLGKPGLATGFIGETAQDCEYGNFSLKRVQAFGIGLPRIFIGLWAEYFRRSFVFGLSYGFVNTEIIFGQAFMSDDIVQPYRAALLLYIKQTPALQGKCFACQRSEPDAPECRPLGRARRLQSSRLFR